MWAICKHLNSINTVHFHGKQIPMTDIFQDTGYKIKYRLAEAAGMCF